MAKAAQSHDLQAGFEAHIQQTREHVASLEQIFEALGESPKGKTCRGMEGLIKEGKEIIDEDSNEDELDAGLISAAQRVEHYEIAGYGCVRTYANLLGDQEAVALLEKTLTEEKETDQKLTQLSEHINVEAMGFEEDDGDSSNAKNRRNTKAKSKSAGA